MTQYKIHVSDREGNAIVPPLDFQNETQAMQKFENLKVHNQRVYDRSSSSSPPVGELRMTHLEYGQWRTIKHECIPDGLNWIICDPDGDCDFSSYPTQPTS